jgi:hypothetical protein
VSESELNTSQESFIALAPDSILSSINEPSDTTHFFFDHKKLQNVGDVQHEARRVKKERDKLKKRKQRLNPDFR